MARTAKILAGLVSAASLAMVAPAAASPTEPEPVTTRQVARSALARLTPEEVKNLESRYPAQAKRVKEAVARASASRGAGTDSASYIAPTGYYTIRNLNSRKCLAIGSGSKANGANAIQWDCLGSPEQIWWITNDFISNYNSGKFLAIGSSSTANGAEAIQWDYTGSGGQRWSMTDDFLTNMGSGKFLAIGSSSTANGAKAIQWDYTGSGGQRWWLTGPA
ncbi:hypothetical protein SLA_3167 [Streptomyces laurentii]|uniref:Ricin B lectin domain-containing protein n=1 Tax=Streptomyces laurentii TaxID=39478 RepID=A0A160P0Y9_STRLU|nr:hypothetical protein SLA_3167 [Streptomyces laurentii]